MNSNPPPTCVKCGQDVPPVLGPPPASSNVWWRNAVTMRRVETVTHVLRLRRYRREWLPTHPADVVRESYTDLVLCDPCAEAVYLFAQNLEVRVNEVRDAHRPIEEMDESDGHFYKCCTECDDASDDPDWQCNYYRALSVISPAAPSVSTDITDEHWRTRAELLQRSVTEHCAGKDKARRELAALREAISSTGLYGSFDGC